MASTRSSKLMRWSYRWLPWLWKRGPCGNMHHRWDRYCYCRMHEYIGEWHGGVYDFRTGEATRGSE